MKKVQGLYSYQSALELENDTWRLPTVQDKTNDSYHWVKNEFIVNSVPKKLKNSTTSLKYYKVNDAFVLGEGSQLLSVILIKR